MNFIRGVLWVASLVAFTTLCRADSVIYMRIDRTILEKRARVAPSTPQERLKTLRAQFRNGGCPDLLEQPVPGEKLPNLVCTLPGDEGGIIVVGARRDYKSHADDEAVEWATLELLPLLAESLNASPHRRTLVFAALTGHDHNFAGSTFYLNSFTEARRKTMCGMIFLDHLGRASPAYAYPFGHSPSRMAEVGKGLGFQPDPRSLDVLVRNVSSAARTLKLPRPPEINDIAATDTRVFAKGDVLAINFHSLGYTTIPAFGGIDVRVMRNDLVPAVYSDTYNLLCVYVLLVDKAVDVPHSLSPSQTSDNPTTAR